MALTKKQARWEAGTRLSVRVDLILTPAEARAICRELAPRESHVDLRHVRALAAELVRAFLVEVGAPPRRPIEDVIGESVARQREQCAPGLHEAPPFEDGVQVLG